MFNASLIIDAPFWRRTLWKSYYEGYITLPTNKTLEIQVMNANSIIGFYLDINFWGEDYAGPILHLYLFGYELMLKVCDCRHWDRAAGKWMDRDAEIS